MSISSPFASELSPQYAVLGFLYFQPLHGYDLHKQLDADLHEFWRISQGQTYNLLKRLEKEGMVTAEHLPQEKRPERARFSLTPLGKERFETWLNQPTRSSARAIRAEFLTRLYFASRLGKETCTRLIGEQSNATRRDLLQLEQRLAAVPPEQTFNRLGLELRVRQLRTLLEWLDTCAASLSL